VAKTFTEWHRHNTWCVWNEDEFVLSRFNRQNSLAIQLLNHKVAVTYPILLLRLKRVIQDWQDSGRLPPKRSHSALVMTAVNRINQRLEVNDRKTRITGGLLVFILLAHFLKPLPLAFWGRHGLPFNIFWAHYSFYGHRKCRSLTLTCLPPWFIMALGIVVDDAWVVGWKCFIPCRSKRRRHAAAAHQSTMIVAIPDIYLAVSHGAAFWHLRLR